jgi:hypothetical protein
MAKRIPTDLTEAEKKALAAIEDAKNVLKAAAKRRVEEKKKVKVDEAQLTWLFYRHLENLVRSGDAVGTQFISSFNATLKPSDKLKEDKIAWIKDALQRFLNRNKKA